jgi:tRNA/rRNA methyltransferase/tRNA (cytidine32/uridine32-2'-O)-methyltransferase
MTLDSVVFVLSRPSESGNIGAACRAMKNMGLTRLRVVAPELPPEDEVIRARAVHAADVWDNAERFDRLEDAIADCSIVVGTTRRRGKKRKDFTLTPEELGAALKERPGRAAIVFGNERTGLEDHELNLCNLAAHIPADSAFPSLNLSHAVQVFAYALYRALGPAEGPRWVPVDAGRIDALVRVIADSFHAIGFYKQAGREEQERFFRDLFARAGITTDESHYLERVFRKMGRLGSAAAAAEDAADASARAVAQVSGEEHT